MPLPFYPGGASFYGCAWRRTLLEIVFYVFYLLYSSFGAIFITRLSTPKMI